MMPATAATPDRTRARRYEPAPPPAAPDMELPADIEAEQATLGSCLLNREAILAVRDWLTPARFYLAKHAQIYQAMLDLVEAGAPPDIRTVAGELKARGQLEGVGGMMYLAGLVEGIPTSYHIAHYAALVDRAAWMRDLIQTGGRLAALGYAGGTVEQVAADAEKLTQELFLKRAHGPRANVEHVDDLWGKAFAPPTWVIDGLLLEGLTLFSGKPKMGKGLVVTNLAAAVASGGKALGVAQALQGDVLYLALEDPESEIQARLERALGGRPSVPISYKMTWRPIVQGGLIDIEGWLQDHPGARLIIIDTFSALAPDEDGRKSAYRADYTALRPLQQLAARHPGLAIIAVTHSRKAGADDVLDEMSGTTGKSGAVDHVWVMRRKRGEPTAELYGELRRAASWARQIIFDAALASWRLGDEVEVAQRSSIRSEILAALADAPAWPKDLADLIDGDRAQVRKQLGVLKRMGQVEVSDRGQYRITEAGRSAVRTDSDPIDQPDPKNIYREDQGSGIRPQGGYRPIDMGDDPTGQGLIPDPRSSAYISSDEPDQTITPPEAAPAWDQLLASVPPAQRFYLRMYLRSTKRSDQDAAKARCAQHGVDYTAAYRLMHGYDPPDAEV